MTDDFTLLDELTGPGEAASNVAELARLFPDAVVDGAVDLDVLRDLLGEEAESIGTEGFGLRWPGMAAARRLSTLPATMTLLPKPDESVDWENTRNIVIEGDNLEVLRLLRRGYTNSVDVIYTDPPYNTGNDFVYDDKRLSTQSEHETAAGLRDEQGALQAGAGSDRAQERKSGASRHSKWLTMMYPRLLVAHNLLKETGVIIVAIDDTEQARLKLLLDRVFGAENFISNLVWQGGRKNDSKFVSVGHDYMLVYAKSLSRLNADDVKWREPKPGVDEVLAQGAKVWSMYGPNQTAATAAMRAWFKGRPKTDPVQAMSRNVYFLPDGRLARDDNVTKPGDWGYEYEVLHPNGKPVAVPERGWVYQKSTMERLIQEGRILFREDHNKPIAVKRPLSENIGQVAMSVFERQRTHAGRRLKEMFEGDTPFDFPKDVNIVARWIALASQHVDNPLIVDFFAGSGSTGHAVMDLNLNDGGRRRYILVQLDESINKAGFETIADITRERLRRAGTQIREQRDSTAVKVDSGFRSYRLAVSNIQPWDGTSELDLLASVDNLVEGRTSDDLLVEMMLRLGIDLVTPVSKREVAGSTLYSLAGTLYAFYGTAVTLEAADEIAKAIVDWRDEDPVDSEITVVVRDTGFEDSSAKLNLAAALHQAGIKNLRSI